MGPPFADSWPRVPSFTCEIQYGSLLSERTVTMQEKMGRGRCWKHPEATRRCESQHQKLVPHWRPTRKWWTWWQRALSIAWNFPVLSVGLSGREDGKEQRRRGARAALWEQSRGELSISTAVHCLSYVQMLWRDFGIFFAKMIHICYKTSKTVCSWLQNNYMWAIEYIHTISPMNGVMETSTVESKATLQHVYIYSWIKAGPFIHVRHNIGICK